MRKTWLAVAAWLCVATAALADQSVPKVEVQGTAQDRDEILAELNYRIVRSLSVLFLPFLA